MKPVDLDALALASLRTELKEGGEEAFRKKYAHPFLVVEVRPASPSEQMDFGTLESDSVDQGNPKPSEPASLVVAVAKSSRNSFDSKILVGRARNNDVVIRSPKISKLHADILLEDGNSYALQDMGSVNGTFLNESRLAKGQTVPLSSGNRLGFWRYRFTFLDLDGFLALLKKP
jgi:pSer/pThr/pTyr-binding forkhead associated (FHA) protein